MEEKITVIFSSQKKGEENKIDDYDRFVPFFEKLVDVIDNRTNSKIVDFGKFLADEEKKNLQTKNEEYLVKIGKLESEKVLFDNDLNELLDKVSVLEEKKIELESELENCRTENLKLDSEYKILESRNKELDKDIEEKNSTINRLETEKSELEKENREISLQLITDNNAKESKHSKK